MGKKSTLNIVNLIQSTLLKSEPSEKPQKYYLENGEHISANVELFVNSGHSLNSDVEKQVWKHIKKWAENNFKESISVFDKPILEMFKKHDFENSEKMLIANAFEELVKFKDKYLLGLQSRKAQK